MPERFRQARLRDYYIISMHIVHDSATPPCKAHKLMHYDPIGFYNERKKLTVTGINNVKDKAAIKAAVDNMNELVRILNIYRFYAPKHKALMCVNCQEAFTHGRVSAKTKVYAKMKTVQTMWAVKQSVKYEEYEVPDVKDKKLISRNVSDSSLSSLASRTPTPPPGLLETMSASSTP